MRPTAPPAHPRPVLLILGPDTPAVIHADKPLVPPFVTGTPSQTRANLVKQSLGERMGLGILHPFRPHLPENRIVGSECL